MKICRICKEEKTLDCFYKHRETRDKLRHECKTCVNKSTSEYYFTNRELQVEKRKEYHYRTRYGISKSEVCKAKQAQDNRCPICLEQGVLVVDHDHSKKHKVRGYLCHKCNQALGSLKDNPDNCFRAGDYLNQKFLE